MFNFREKFTKWYYRKGYLFGYDPNDRELVFKCPFWVRPFVSVFFSPCTYYRETGYLGDKT